MMIVKLKVEEKQMDEVLTELSKIGISDIEIIDEKTSFPTQKHELENEWQKVEENTAKYFSLQEADLFLEEAIKAYESKTLR